MTMYNSLWDCRKKITLLRCSVMAVKFCYSKELEWFIVLNRLSDHFTVRKKWFTLDGECNSSLKMNKFRNSNVIMYLQTHMLLLIL
jgi:hypothetical protein